MHKYARKACSCPLPTVLWSTRWVVARHNLENREAAVFQYPENWEEGFSIITKEDREGGSYLYVQRGQRGLRWNSPIFWGVAFISAF